MTRFSRPLLVAAVVLAMLVAAAPVHSQELVSGAQASGEQTRGAEVISQRYVETSDGLVWTIYGFKDAGGTFEAAIEGGVNNAGMRLEVSGWPQPKLGQRYETRLGEPVNELQVLTLLDVREVTTTGGGDADPGYALGPATWGRAAKNLEWHANSATFPPLNQQQVLDALGGGLDAWTTQAGQTSLSFSYGGSTPIATNAFDGVNAIYWSDTSADETYLARTYLWFTDPDGNSATPGDAVEFDIKFNNDYDWSIGAQSGRYDLLSVAIHESGHVVGLSHASSRANAMYPSLIVGTTMHRLGQGDIDGMRALYGTNDVVNTNPTELKCKGKLATVVGTGGNDTLTGGPGPDVIVGLGGNDVINGGGGNDIICGGSGSDTLIGGPGRDKLIGGSGNDELRGDGGKDFLSGGSGTDELRGGKMSDTLKGGGGGDVLFGEGGDDLLKGGGGSDLLVGGGGADELFGGPGTDTLTAGSTDRSDGGRGTDTCSSRGQRVSCELDL